MPCNENDGGGRALRTTRKQYRAVGVRDGGHRPKPLTIDKSSVQDQQFEERRRIAERLVQAFREAGYSFAK